MVSRDTDGLVLSLYFKVYLPKEFQIKCGTLKWPKYVPVHEMKLDFTFALNSIRDTVNHFAEGIFKFGFICCILNFGFICWENFK